MRGLHSNRYHQPDAIDVNYTTEDVSCFGYQDGRLVINGVTGGIGTYSLAFNSDTIISNLSSATIDTLSTGLNVFTIIDGNDCPLTLMFTIDEPDVKRCRLMFVIQGVKVSRTGRLTSTSVVEQGLLMHLLLIPSVVIRVFLQG